MGIRESARDMPVAPFQAQQACLALDDNMLEGHTAEEVDTGGEDNHPPGSSGELSTGHSLCFST